MKLKKLLSVLCACALIFALAVPAFASSATSGNIPNDTETEFKGDHLPDEDNGVTVSISVLYSLKKLYVNPYGLPYKIADAAVMVPDPDNPGQMKKGDDKIQEGVVTDGWFSDTAIIKNDAKDSLKVSVTMTTTTHGAVEVVLPANAPQANNTPDNNTLYGKFQITDATYDTAKKTYIPGDWTVAADKPAKEADIPVGAAANVKGTPTKSNIGYILKGEHEETDQSTGRPYTSAGYAAFRMRGSAVIGANSASPGDAGWGQNDLADVSVAFSFAPNDD